MKQTNIQKSSGIFRIAMVILVLVIITSLVVIGTTWASYPASHTLTYTTNKLTWDRNTKVLSDGSAELSVFSTSYDNVESEDEDKVIAPGTTQTDSIVLRNTVDRAITYTAIAYYIKNDSRIPVDMQFDGTGLADTSDYTLPSGIEESQVLRVVSGKLKGNGEQDFNFRWNWDYETEELTSDPSDTELGDDSAAGEDEDVTVGLYIVVQDKGPDKDNGNGKEGTKTITPDTGDTSNLLLYVVLAVVCLLVLLLLLFTGRRKEDRDKRDGNEESTAKDKKDGNDRHED